MNKRKRSSLAIEARELLEAQKKHFTDNQESKLDSFAKELKGNEFLKMKVSEIDVYNEDLKGYVLTCSKRVPIGEYGQIISLVLNINGGRFTRRFTVLSYPDPYSYKILVYRTPMSGNHILDNWRVGVEVLVSYPVGDFYFNPLLDHRLLCVAKGHGAISILAMLKGVVRYDIPTKVIYIAESEKEFYLKKDFELAFHNFPSISVEYIVDGGTYVIDQSLLDDKFKEDFSFFYSANEKSPTILGDLKPKREVYNLLQQTVSFRYPMIEGSKVSKTFSLVVRAFGEEYPPIPADSSESLLVAIERAGIHAPSICRDGKCGYCLSRLIKGDIYVPGGKYSTESERLYKLIHPCVSYPLSDIILDIPLEE